MLNALEKLMAEYDNDLTIEFSKDLPKGIPGYIMDTHIVINANLRFDKALAVLAEEIGHHETSAGDILNYDDYRSMRQETKARRWSYKKLIPYRQLIDFVTKKDVVHRYELAEEFGVPEEFIEETLRMYSVEGYI